MNIDKAWVGEIVGTKEMGPIGPRFILGPINVIDREKDIISILLGKENRNFKSEDVRPVWMIMSEMEETIRRLRAQGGRKAINGDGDKTLKKFIVALDEGKIDKEALHQVAAATEETGDIRLQEVLEVVINSNSS